MSTHLSAYPNPFRETISLEVEVDENISTIVRIVNDGGKIIKLLSWNLKPGTNKTSLHDLETLAEGNYFVDFKDMKGNNLFSARLQKK
jgi:type IX secretion system substrate protein